MVVILPVSGHVDVELHYECTNTSFAARTKDGGTQSMNVQRLQQAHSQTGILGCAFYPQKLEGFVLLFVFSCY